MQFSLGALATAGLPTWYAQQLLAAQESSAAKKTSANDRLVMGIVGIGSPQSRSLQVVGESRPCLESGQLTFTLGCDVDAAHRKRATEVMRQRGLKDFEPNTKDFRDLVNETTTDCGAGVLAGNFAHSTKSDHIRNWCPGSHCISPVGCHRHFIARGATEEVWRVPRSM